MVNDRWSFILFVAAVLGGSSWAVTLAAGRGPAGGPSGGLSVYVGTYTRGASRGIYLLHMDPGTGRLRPSGLAAEVTNPSFLALHPTQRFLYAVGETARFAGRGTGAVTAFSIDPGTGKLRLLNQRASHGAGPCHLVVDRTGRYVLVANYGGGSVACLPIEEDGRVGEATCWIQHEGASVNPRRQQGPHAHSINLDVANRFAVVADLGLDKLLIYRFDATGGKLTPNDPPWAKLAPGAGPRHLAFHPNGRFAYVINELDSTVSVFRYAPQRGALDLIQTASTLPPSFSGENTTAEIQIHPTGKFLYGSNRGHDSIVVFSVDPRTGRIRPVAHQAAGGRTPRNFAIDPAGAYLLAANQATDNISVFRIDLQTGRLVVTGQTADVPSPVCVTFLDGGKRPSLPIPSKHGRTARGSLGVRR